MVATKRDTSKKRESILDGALQAFMEEGYESTSMDRIAEVAGASKRTVYNHFPSKEELFLAVFNRMLAEVIALKQIAYDPDRSLEEQLGKFADAKREFVRNPVWLGMMKVTISVFISHPDLARETMMRAEDHENTLAAWLRAAHEDGRMDVPDPELAAEVFWAMMGGAFLLPVVFHGPMEEEQAVTMKGELIRTFLARYER